MIDVTVGAKVAFNSITIVIAWVFHYLGMDSEIFFLFAMLLTIDYITGIAKAKTLQHSIASDKMKYGIISKLLLLLIPLVLAISAKAVGADFKSILQVGMNILILSELYSIIGNIYAVRTKDELPEYDAVASIGKKIKSFLIRAEKNE